MEALRQYNLLDTDPEQGYNDIALLASSICGTPIALMTLVDNDRQWFKARIGLEARETPRDHAFCAHTILRQEPLVVEDATRDSRFSTNPLVASDPHIRFYAGAPLLSPQGFGLGSLCVIDRTPRKITADQLKSLEALARLVVTQMELRRVSAELAEAASNLKTLSGLLPMCAYCKGIRDDQGYWQQVERYVETHSHSTFSHGICPHCAHRHFPDFDLSGCGPNAMIRTK